MTASTTGQPLAFENLESGAGAPLGPGLTHLDLVQAELRVCVGRTRMSLADLVAARANQVIELDSLIDAPVDIMAGEAVIARGQLVAVDEHFAVRLTELPRIQGA